MSLSKLLFIDVEDDTVESVSVESFNVDPEPAPEPWLKDEPAWLRESNVEPGPDPKKQSKTHM